MSTPMTEALTEHEPLNDIQSTRDERQVDIDKVGVKNVTYPIRLRTREGGELHTVAKVNMYVSLPHHLKGTHMSRFLEVLQEHCQELTPQRIRDITHRMKERLDAEESHLELEFTYFMKKKAPVTQLESVLDFQVSIVAHSNCSDDFVLGVKVPATSLCPCSKEISRYGAHNQRCEIEAKVRFNGTLWIEDLIEMIESCASSELYAILKRPDEKYVTEYAYDHPKFVEDIVRDLAVRLNEEDRIEWFSISSENFESIHNHNAYAAIERDKRN